MKTSGPRTSKFTLLGRRPRAETYGAKYVISTATLWQAFAIKKKKKKILFGGAGPKKLYSLSYSPYGTSCRSVSWGYSFYFQSYKCGLRICLILNQFLTSPICKKIVGGTLVIGGACASKINHLLLRIKILWRSAP